MGTLVSKAAVSRVKRIAEAKNLIWALRLSRLACLTGIDLTWSDKSVQLLKNVAWALLPEVYLQTRLLKTGKSAHPTIRNRPRHNTAEYPVNPNVLGRAFVNHDNVHLAKGVEHGAKRTKGLTVCLAQPKNRRFAGLGKRCPIKKGPTVWQLVARVPLSANKRW